MIKRISATLLFGLFGFPSLLLADRAREWLCLHIAGACRVPDHVCPIDVCTPDTAKSIALAGFYFGPAIVFAISAALFSRRRHPLVAWLVLLAALMTAHSVIAFALTSL